MLLLSAAIARSGLVERGLSPVLGILTTPQVQIPAFAGAVMLLSMVTKNIGALAIVMPIAIQQARKTGTPVGSDEAHCFIILENSPTRGGYPTFDAIVNVDGAVLNVI